jgi:hypothetical protein
MMMMRMMMMIMMMMMRMMMMMMMMMNLNILSSYANFKFHLISIRFISYTRAISKEMHTLATLRK